MKIINFGRRRKWVEFKKWLSKKFDPAETDLTSEQDKAYRITKKLIIDSNSVLYADVAGKSRYLIVNGNRFVRLTSSKIRIIDGPYKYDVSFDPRRLDELRRVFAKNLEHRHDRIEAAIGDKVEKSLDHILKDLIENQNDDN